MSVEDLNSGGPFGTATYVIGLAVPDCTHTIHDQGGGIRTLWLYGLGDRSWAAVVYRDSEAGAVHQCGPRRLWDEAESAWRWWDQQQRPSVDRFGLTVTATGDQLPWLDDPAQPVPQQLAIPRAQPTG